MRVESKKPAPDESSKVKPGDGAVPGNAKVIAYGIEQYECLICDTKQLESKGPKFRAARVRCRHCGRMAYPVSGAVEKPVKVRNCEDCGTKLRATNTSTRCSLHGGR